MSKFGLTTEARYPPAHNGLVAGSSPAGPTNDINDVVDFDEAPQWSGWTEAPSRLRTSMLEWKLEQHHG
jgi:hypothetical protein